MNVITSLKSWEAFLDLRNLNKYKDSKIWTAIYFVKLYI